MPVESLPTPPGYVSGAWAIDPVHSSVGFIVRHLMVSKLRGQFGSFSATLTTAEDIRDCAVTAEVDLASFDTGHEFRDHHIRSAEFLEIDRHPTMTYRSTGLRFDGTGYVLDGELTLKGVTLPVSLSLEVNGFGPDAHAGTRAGFSATGEINRYEFGVSGNKMLDGGVVMIGEKVQIQIEIEAVLQAG
ncbi:YceI family protein [Cryptosporangium aurantiacum]|uniref:Polyisoprenoid-binding protein YceI n=1 Tax=Cryptosporangium aurantiacum TaxID=134849 RepID=A0A1M7PF76_9ACTN|nr:YceI family protein [Cryptosporangium aurantiacum]SHN15280.1 Polyisoprenoid-binding protein YceI [Cryptosporangium aurantiacum]